ncbi:uncharacterized protein PAC_12338 [Phialocephala subalpina]|uniref:Uncharacterized protein n=1 Tax=Phialocephala subalpina TaxID=576137 RepID=A0A1L7XBP2_9HELO|nr:uncharacterized protein PAC_12338 [Phialocephala subalpina]
MLAEGISFLHILRTFQSWYKIAKAENAKIAQEVAHRAACEFQTKFRLLTLPRELRDKIWAEVVTGNIIHISKGYEHDSKRLCRGHPRRAKFFYHACVASNGLRSTACPAGKGDRVDCSTDGPSGHCGISLVCKQISMELPKFGSMLSRNALQFSNLITAEEYLFGLDENTRASITHLRLAVTYALTTLQYLHHYRDGAMGGWRGILNYFSNPWDTKTRWKVGRGNTSWDIGIAELKYKGCPRLDIAMECPAEDELTNEAAHNYSPERPAWRTTFDEDLQSWIVPLSQFRNYDRNILLALPLDLGSVLSLQGGMGTRCIASIKLELLEKHPSSVAVGHGDFEVSDKAPGTETSSLSSWTNEHAALCHMKEDKRQLHHSSEPS